MWPARQAVRCTWPDALEQLQDIAAILSVPRLHKEVTRYLIRDHIFQLYNIVRYDIQRFSHAGIILDLQRRKRPTGICRSLCSSRCPPGKMPSQHESKACVMFWKARFHTSSMSLRVKKKKLLLLLWVQGHSWSVFLSFGSSLPSANFCRNPTQYGARPL